MFFKVKAVTAGPRGNSCRKCERKVKAPDVVLQVHGEVNRFSGYQKIDKYCPECGVKGLEKSISTLKKLVKTLEKGPSDKSELGNKREVKVI